MSIIAEVTDRVSALRIAEGHADPEDFCDAIAKTAMNVQSANTQDLVFDYRRELITLAALAIKAIEVSDQRRGEPPI